MCTRNPLALFFAFLLIFAGVTFVLLSSVCTQTFSSVPTFNMTLTICYLASILGWSLVACNLFGLLALLKESTCLIAIYVMFLFVLFTLQATIGGMALVANRRASRLIIQTYTYVDRRAKTDHYYRTILADMMDTWKCCGLDDSNNRNDLVTRPQQCCRFRDADDYCNPKDGYVNSCVIAGSTLYHSSVGTMGICGLIFGLYTLVPIVFSVRVNSKLMM